MVGINPTVTTYSGGFGASPPIPPGHRDGDLSVRALYVGNGRRAVEVAVVDSQAWFAAYQEGPDLGITGARRDAAREIDAGRLGPALSPSDIVIQASHSHSAPTLEGLWGPVPSAYLRQVHDAAVAALVAAARSARPAHLQVAVVGAPYLDNETVAQYDSFPGWSQDGQLTAMRAVQAATGATIATFVTVPAHPDIICGACLGVLTPDYPGTVRRLLEQQLGGVAIVGPATLGREETGVQATGLADMAWFARVVDSVAIAGLAHARWVSKGSVAGTERFVTFPGTNAALLALNHAWALPPAQRQQVEDATGEYPIDRADSPPYLTGAVVGTWVSALRIGDLALLSLPGEPFPEVRATIARAVPGARTVVALSKAQDDLGYFYPAWVTPAGVVYPSDTVSNSVAPEAGDAIIAAQVDNLRGLGFATGAPLAAPPETDPVQTTRPGLQALAAPMVGDAGPDGTLAVALQALYSPPDLPEGTVNYGLPASPPVGLDQVPPRPVEWRFGDGTSGTSGYHQFSGPDLAPTLFVHRFPAGIHNVRLAITDAAGQAATWALVVQVYPALTAGVIARPLGRGRYRYQGTVAGGDGVVLAWRWNFSDGTAAAGPVVTHAFAPGITPAATLWVTDGTATLAVAKG